jgi:AraC-like DNA-binding protein
MMQTKPHSNVFPPLSPPGMVPELEYLVYRKCTPTWQIKEAVFDFWDITYLTEGGARYTIDGKVYDLTEGDLFCMPPGHVRTAKILPGKLMQCFAVNFRLRDPQGRDIKLPFSLISPIGHREDLIHLFQEFVFTWMERPPGYLIKAHGMFLLILHRLYELLVYNTDSETVDFRVKKVARYIAAHYPEKISVKDMAAMTGLNAVYFGALFKQETGLTMGRYLINTRIRNAENMLRSGEYKVGEAAELCGYNDTFHFYKQFKQVCGIAPSECVPKKREY